MSAPLDYCSLELEGCGEISECGCSQEQSLINATGCLQQHNHNIQLCTGLQSGIQGAPAHAMLEVEVFPELLAGSGWLRSCCFNFVIVIMKQSA